VAGLFETMKICQDTLYRLYHERFDQPGSVAASDNNPINVADANQVSMGGGFDTEVSDFLSAVFQPILTMPNADLLPTKKCCGPIWPTPTHRRSLFIQQCCSP